MSLTSYRAAPPRDPPENMGVFSAAQASNWGASQACRHFRIGFWSAFVRLDEDVALEFEYPILNWKDWPRS
jgi:hypothetical protein